MQSFAVDPWRHCHRQVQVQLRPLWCRHLQVSTSLCSVDNYRSITAPVVYTYVPLGTAQPMWGKHVQVQLRPLWCRHVQEQHRLLLSKEVFFLYCFIYLKQGKQLTVFTWVIF
jgi:hypothetical protein